MLFILNNHYNIIHLFKNDINIVFQMSAVWWLACTTVLSWLFHTAIQIYDRVGISVYVMTNPVQNIKTTSDMNLIFNQSICLETSDDTFGISHLAICSHDETWSKSGECLWTEVIMVCKRRSNKIRLENFLSGGIVK